MSDWKPIESAPKDGATVLVFTELGVAAAYYGGGNWFVAGTLDEGLLCRIPTHWMPLPEPPK